MTDKKIVVPLELQFNEKDASKLVGSTGKAFNEISTFVTNLTASVSSLGKGLPALLNRVAASVTRLNDSLQGIDTSKLTNFAKQVAPVAGGLKSIGEGIKPISATKRKELAALGDALDDFSVSTRAVVASGFEDNANKISVGLNRIALAANNALKAKKTYLEIQRIAKQTAAIGNTAATPNPRTSPGNVPQVQNIPPPQQVNKKVPAFVKPINEFQDKIQQVTKSNQNKSKKGFLGLDVARIDEILPSRGPIVQLTGLLFLLQGAAFGIARVFERLTSVTLGANIALEKQVISLAAIVGSYEEAKKVIQDFAIPFAANVPFFESSNIIDAVNRLSAEGFGIDQITGRLEAGFNKFTGKFEQEFEGGLVKTLGSTAVAFGRTLDQSVDAFISAIQGRFTKIRRFGVEKGDLKAFGFVEGGDFATNAQALQSLLEVRFGDLIRQQADTFTGAISNIQDVLSNLSRAAFEDTFKRIRDELIGFVKTLSSYEKAFSTALATEDEFIKKLEKLDPAARRNALNLRAISKALGNFTGELIKAGQFILQFKEVLFTVAIAPIITIGLAGLAFAFQKLTESVGRFLGILDKEGNFLIPKFIKNFGKLKEKLKVPFSGLKESKTLTFLSKSTQAELKALDTDLQKFAARKEKYANIKLNNPSDAAKNLLAKKIQEADAAISAIQAKTLKLTTTKSPVVAAFDGIKASIVKAKDATKDFQVLLRGTGNQATSVSAQIKQLSDTIRKQNVANAKVALGDALKGGARGAKVKNLEAIVFGGKQSGLLNGLGFASKLIDAIAKTLNSLGNFKLSGVTKAFSGLGAVLSKLVPIAEGSNVRIISSFAKFIPTLKSVGGLLGSLGGLAKGAFGPISAVFGVVFKAVGAAANGIGFLTQAFGVLAATILSAFTGVFKFFLIPAIIESIFALKELAQGLETVRTRSFKGLIEAFKTIGAAIELLVNDILIEVGLFTSLSNDGNGATKVITKLLSIATQFVEYIRAAVPTVGSFFTSFLKGATSIVSMTNSLFKFGVNVAKVLIPGIVAFGSAATSVFGFVGDALDVLSNGSTTFGDSIRELGGTLTTSMEKLVPEIDKVTEAVDVATEAVANFSKGKNPTGSVKSTLNEIFKGATGSTTQLSEALGSGSAEALQKASRSGLKAFSQPSILRKIQRGLATFGSPAGNSELFDKTKPDVAENLFKEITKQAEKFVGNNPVFDYFDKNKGQTRKVTFKQFMDLDPASASRELRDGLVEPVEKQIALLTARIGSLSFDEQALLKFLKDYKAGLDKFAIEAQVLAPVFGKPFQEATSQANNATTAAKGYIEALKLVKEAEGDRVDEKTALGKDVFNLKLQGASQSSIDAAQRRSDAATAKAFSSRNIDVSQATELSRLADVNKNAASVNLDVGTKKQQDSSTRAVKNLREAVEKEFGKITLDDGILKTIVESTNPAAELKPLRKAIADSLKADDQFKAVTFLKNQLPGIREAAVEYQNLTEGVGLLTDAQKQASEASAAAIKLQSELIENQKADISNAKLVVSQNVQLGKISTRQAFEQLVAIQRVRKETASLSNDIEGAINDQKERISAAKTAISDVGLSLEDSIGADNAADTLNKAYKAFQATRDILGELSDEDRKLSDVISENNKAYKDRVKAVNDFAKAQQDARVELLNLRREQQLQNIELRTASRLTEAAGNFTRKPLDILNQSSEAQDASLQSEQDRISLNDTLEKQSLSQIAAEKELSIAISRRDQLVKDARETRIKGFNASGIREAEKAIFDLQTKNLTSLKTDQKSLEEQKALAYEKEKKALRDVVSLQREQAKASEELANSRKSSANDVLDVQKKVLLALRGTENLTSAEDADLTRAKINNTSRALTGSTSFDSVKGNINELADLFVAARSSGQFGQNELDQISRTLVTESRRLRSINPESDKQREFNQREQLLAQTRDQVTKSVANTAALTNSMQTLGDKIVSLTQAVDKQAGKALDSALINGSISRIKDTADSQSTGAFVTKNAGLDTKQNEFKAVATQFDFIPNLVGKVTEGADKLSSASIKVSEGFKGVEDTLVKTTALVNRSTLATFKVVERLEAMSQKLAQNKSLVDDAGKAIYTTLSQDNSSLALQDLERLKEYSSKNPAVPKTETVEQNGTAQEQTKVISASLDKLSETLNQEKDVTINMTLDGSSLVGLERLILNSLYQGLRPDLNPKKDIK